MACSSLLCLLFSLLLPGSDCGLLPGDGVILNTGVSSGGAVLPSGSSDPNWAYASGTSRFPADYGSWAAATTQAPTAALTASAGLASIAPSANSFGVFRHTFAASRPLAYITVTWQTDDYCVLFLNGAQVYADTCDYGNSLPSSCWRSTRTRSSCSHRHEGNCMYVAAAATRAVASQASAMVLSGQPKLK